MSSPSPTSDGLDASAVSSAAAPQRSSTGLASIDDNDFDPYVSPSEPSTSNPLYLAIDLSSSLPSSPVSLAPSSGSLPSLLSSSLSAPFDHCLFPLSSPAIPSSALTLSPLSFPSSTFSSSFIPILPSSIILPLLSPSSSPSSLRLASAQFKACYDFYQHLGISHVVISLPSFPSSLPSSLPSPHLSQCLYSALLSHPYMNISIAFEPSPSSLFFYHHLLHSLDHPQRVTFAFLITPSLPPPSLLSQLKGEQMRLLLLSTDCFITNSRQCPILPLTHRQLLIDMLNYCTTIVLSPPSPTLPSSLILHQHYLHHLSSLRPPPSSFNPTSYHDFLQAPLQPLHDNLENQTYEVFERDPVKYKLYQQAISLALRDRQGGKVVRVWVVGAGRGPLVNAVLAASSESKVPVAITAIEKNVHALYTLHTLQSSLWQGQGVRVVHGNILHYDPKGEKCDILVSELLGSFGDNELSPECLDAACQWLEEGGVCIPERSVSWVVPVRDEGVTGMLMGGGGVGGKAGKESGYVVDLHACEKISREDGRVCFVFAHPRKEGEEEEAALVKEEEEKEERRLARSTDLEYHSDIRTAPSTPSLPPASSNARYRELPFTLPETSLPFPSPPRFITGLACYFHARLYRHIALSTYPPTASEGMGSWFALYLPLRAPVWVGEGGEVRVRVWRVIGEDKVWYEWQVEVRKDGTMTTCTHIHNAGGAAAVIGL